MKEKLVKVFVDRNGFMLNAKEFSLTHEQGHIPARGSHETEIVHTGGINRREYKRYIVDLVI